MNNLTWAEIGEYVTANLPKDSGQPNVSLHRTLGNQACRKLAELTRLYKRVWDNSDRVIAAGEAAWTPAANVLATVDYTYRVVGKASAHLHIEDAFGSTGTVAYVTIAQGALNLATIGVTQIALRVRSSIARAAGAFTVGLDSSATFGGTESGTKESVALPAIYQPHQWVRVVLNLTTAQKALTPVTVGLTAAVDPGHSELYIDDVQLLMPASLGGGLAIDGNSITLPVDMLLPPDVVEWDGSALVGPKTEAELDLICPGWRTATGTPRVVGITDARTMVLNTSPGSGNEGKLVIRGKAYLPDFSDDTQEPNPMDYVAAGHQFLVAYYVVSRLPVQPARPVAATGEAIREAMEETQRRVAVKTEHAILWEQGLAEISGAVARATKVQFVA